MFSPGDLVAAQWCLYKVLIAERTWRYRDSDGGVLFVFICAYGWDESLLLSSEGRVCRLATASLVGVLMFVSARSDCWTHWVIDWFYLDQLRRL